MIEKRGKYPRIGCPASPYLRVNVATGILRLNYTTIEKLGAPPHVEFLWDGGDILAIAACGEDTQAGVVVNNCCLIYRKEAQVSRRAFVAALAAHIGWHRVGSYKAAGEYDEAARVVGFDLKKAVMTDG